MLCEIVGTWIVSSFFRFQPFVSNQLNDNVIVFVIDIFQGEKNINTIYICLDINCLERNVDAKKIFYEVSCNSGQW